MRQIGISESWKLHLGTEFKQSYMDDLREYLLQRKQAGANIYPPGKLIFNAFNSTPFEQVRVVIIGQDPYHGPGQAHGLAFSVPSGLQVPPSLVNIYKELQQDTGFIIPQHGNLKSWTENGVLLLNAVLTVEQGKAGAHQGKGWEYFTDRVIQVLNDESEGLVFMLWGAYAQSKGRLLNAEKHCVLKSPHPSPLSAYRGFLGCKHFSRANAYLQQRGRQPVNWQLPLESGD